MSVVSLVVGSVTADDILYLSSGGRMSRSGLFLDENVMLSFTLLDQFAVAKDVGNGDIAHGRINCSIGSRSSNSLLHDKLCS